MVRIDVDGFVWIKRGCVVAYHGDLRFHLEPVVQAEALRLASGPARSALKREAVPYSRAEGKGCLYLSNEGKYARVVRLENESIFAVSSDLLAFESTIDHQILMPGGVGVLAGGLFVVRLSGTGAVAFSTHGEPMTMRVTAREEVSTIRRPPSRGRRRSGPR